METLVGPGCPAAPLGPCRSHITALLPQDPGPRTQKRPLHGLRIFRRV